MKRIQAIGRLILWTLQGLLAILLIFQETFTLPIHGIGHLHPLLLHLPIGFGVLLILLYFWKQKIEDIEQLFQAVFMLTALFATSTAIFGLFLAKEGGYENGQLDWHQWSGVAVSFIYFIGMLWQQQALYASILGAIALIFAGHTGGQITHGEDYLNFSEQQLEITEESVAFEALVQPILKAKCESCHNEQKSKGGLKMNSLANLLKGGKNGPIWKAGDLNSHLIKRIHLPLKDKKHMPPAGKSQLTENEQMILQLWIQEGANVQQKVKSFSHVFQKLALKTETKLTEKTYDFSAASEKDIAAVNTPFCSVYPIANESPALQATFFVAAKFDPKTLENLGKVETQLIGINLNKMPVSDSEMDIFTKFLHLEKLYLNSTKITDKGLQKLAELPNLVELSISSTSISKNGLSQFLKHSKSIQKVFVWNTAIQDQEMTTLKKQFPKVYIEEGFVSKNETLQINPPILVNEKLILRPQEQLKFKHTLKDVLFRYTLNDSLPDSLSGPSTSSIVPLKNYTKVRIRASKPGWYASNTIDVKVYKSNFVPQKIELLQQPDTKYPAHGGQSLMDFEQGAREVKGVPNRTWLGFKEGDLEALARFSQPTKINGITLSYLEKTDTDVFPPSKIEIWAGNDPKQMKLITQFVPKQPTEKSGFSLKGINIPVQTNAASYYKIKAHRLNRLPNFVDNKGKGAWLRVDEWLFY